jgi:LysR family cys regulon transcriptional activator
MNIRALQSLCEVVDRGLRISDAAGSLNRSQPSVTRQVQELEREVGFSIFERRRNRILRVTPQGEELIAISRRVLHEMQNIRRLSGDVSRANEGPLTIATTNTQARHILPRFLNAYTASYPKVSLTLQQADPVRCHELVSDGQADISICTAVPTARRDVAFVPCYLLSRALVVPSEHPLLQVKPLTLEAIARHPLITYNHGFSGRHAVEHAFQSRGLTPHIVVNALDADVAKAFVEQGLGVAVLATISFNAERDTKLRCRPAAHLFASSQLGIVLRRNSYLRGYMVAFVRAFAPHIARARLDDAIAGVAPPPQEELPAL